MKLCSCCKSAYSHSTLPEALWPAACPSCMTPAETEAWIKGLPERHTRTHRVHSQYDDDLLPRRWPGLAGR